MATALINGRVLIDGALRDGVAVVVGDTKVVAVVPFAEAPADRIDLAGDILAPGFIDTQVNGGANVLFNDDPSVEAIARIGAAHRAFGTTGFLPTLISDDISVITLAVDAVDAAIEAGVPGVLGIHIEGPFLNVERKGIHRAEKILALDEAGFAQLVRLKRGCTLVTLAPERTTADFIRRLVGAGVRVAAGHTEASYEEAVEAIEAGLSGITHLFNAMPPLANRAPGIVGAALSHSSVMSGIIVDGRHVHPATLKIALRARGPEGFMLVTDAMPSVGGAPDFMLQGTHIRVEGGVCVDDSGTLAGSSLDMTTAVRNCVEMLDVPAATALEMASLHPARFLQVDDRYGTIKPGTAANFVRLSAGLRVAGTCFEGRWSD